MTSLIRNLLPILTLGADILLAASAVLALIAWRHVPTRTWLDHRVFPFIKKHILLLNGTVALTGTLGSLFYSEILHFTPCLLCWFQRIFLYPQVFLYALALKKKDTNILAYSGVLSVVGLAIALYHYSLQLQVNPFAPCSALGYSVSCAEKFVLQYGYITIPVMSATAFALILAGIAVERYRAPKPSVS